MPGTDVAYAVVCQRNARVHPVPTYRLPGTDIAYAATTEDAASIASSDLDGEEDRDRDRDREGEERGRLAMESVRRLAEELGREERDPTGELLVGREQLARDKRLYALRLLVMLPRYVPMRCPVLPMRCPLLRT
eukprot:3941037-Rhodomonas_salina.2